MDEFYLWIQIAGYSAFSNDMDQNFCHPFLPEATAKPFIHSRADNIPRILSNTNMAVWASLKVNLLKTSRKHGTEACRRFATAGFGSFANTYIA